MQMYHTTRKRMLKVYSRETPEFYGPIGEVLLKFMLYMTKKSKLKFMQSLCWKYRHFHVHIYQFKVQSGYIKTLFFVLVFGRLQFFLRTNNTIVL